MKKRKPQTELTISLMDDAKLFELFGAGQATTESIARVVTSPFALMVLQNLASFSTVRGNSTTGQTERLPASGAHFPYQRRIKRGCAPCRPWMRTS